MSLEADVTTTLLTQCPRVFPGTAPVATARPFVTWDHVGGDPLRYVDGTAADKRMANLQITVWADRKAEGMALMLAIETALCSAGAYTASPVGGFAGGFEHDADLYRHLQEFQILGAR